MPTTGAVAPQKAPKQVIVTISVDTTKNEIIVDPANFDFNSNVQDEVVWRCNLDNIHKTDACFVVHFVGTSPFAEFAFTGGPEAHSGHRVKGSKGGSYKYNLWVPGFKIKSLQGGVHP
jgi:hypothetical protein